MFLNSTLKIFIAEFITNSRIKEDRKAVLQPLIEYIKEKGQIGDSINLNFICTHNSRRSHLCQIWAQVASAYYQINHVFCYSGGTEITSIYPRIIETLKNQGFGVFKLTMNENPIYAIRYSQIAFPINGFSKIYDSEYNPASNFAAIMTCSNADDGCPYIPGAEKRIPITYLDPKLSDNTTDEESVYHNCSVEIAREMFYVFSQIDLK